MPFQSEFKKNDQLKACAVSDPAHIGQSFNSRGEHVKLIIKALNAWLDREDLNPKPAKLNESLDIYTVDVAKRVALFKTKKGILNFRNQIDDIVGIKTVAALDKELPIELDPIDVVTSFVDVIVFFKGAGARDAPRFLGAGEVMPDGLLAPYLANKIIPKKRSLIRIGHTTTGFGSAMQGIRAQVLDNINRLMVPGLVFGKVFIFGSSSGGRNAIEFTNEFAIRNRNVDILYVADAAFFPQDSPTVPDFVPKPTNIPVFVVPAAANDRRNFFQTAGNQSEKRTFSDQKIFVSEMDGKEIHGEIVGFTPFNQTRFVASSAGGLEGKDRDDTFHIECIRIALSLIQGDISLTLNILR